MNRIVQSFEQVDFSDMLVPMITVYDRPLDFPNHYVARIFECARGGPLPTDVMMIADTLADIRDGIPQSRFIRLERNALDDPHVVETWV